MIFDALCIILDVHCHVGRQLFSHIPQGMQVVGSFDSEGEMVVFVDFAAKLSASPWHSNHTAFYILTDTSAIWS
jgi:hypothetical protein